MKPSNYFDPDLQIKPIIYYCNVSPLKISQDIVTLVNLEPSCLGREVNYTTLVVYIGNIYQVAHVLISEVLEIPIAVTYTAKENEKDRLKQYSSLPQRWFGIHERKVLLFDGTYDSSRNVENRIKKWYKETTCK